MSIAAVHHAPPLRLVLIGLAALAVPACGGDSAATTITDHTTVLSSTASADTSPAVVVAPASTTGPVTTTTGATTTTSTGAAAAAVVLAPANERTELHAGELVRFETEGADFELSGQDGWVAFATPVSVWFTTWPDLGRAWVSVLHLKNGHPELGTDADLGGVAIPADPHVKIADLLLPDGSPNLASLLPLPDDWFGYLATLPGLTVGEPSPTSLGEITGDAVTYVVGEMSDAPQPYCANGLLSWIELQSSWCLVEGEAGTILVAEADGERYELNVGTNEHATADDEAALETVLASLRMV